MPYSAPQLRPGINTTVTQTQNKNGWSLSNLIRWKFASGNAYLEKIGGWQKLFTQTIAGIGRALHAFQDLGLNDTLLIAGDGGAQTYIDGTLYNFTFIRPIQRVVDGDDG